MSKSLYITRWLKISSWDRLTSSIKSGDINFWQQFGAVLSNSTTWAIQREIAAKWLMLYFVSFRLLLLFCGLAGSISTVGSSIMRISTRNIFINMKIFTIRKSLSIFYLQTIIELAILLSDLLDCFYLD